MIYLGTVGIIALAYDCALLQLVLVIFFNLLSSLKHKYKIAGLKYSSRAVTADYLT